MRKVWSVILALAMAATCLSVVPLFTGAQEGDPVGVKVTFDKATAKTGTGILSNDDIVDGKVTKTITVYNVSNPSSEARTIMVAYQTTHTRSNGRQVWTGPSTTQLIPYGEHVDVTVEIPVNDDNTVTIDDEGVGYYTLDTFFLRIDLKSATGLTGVQDGSQIIMVENNLDMLYALSGTGISKEYVYELPADPTPTPTDEPTPTPSDEPTPTPSGDPTPTATTAPTPGYAQMVNGNAESGTTGWMPFTNGEIVQVTPGANGTAHAIEYRNAGNKWGSIGFDLGPAIIQDKAAGYNGAGPGTYKITFWAKAEAGKGGNFNFLINSKWHRMTSAIKALGGDYADAQHGTMLSFENDPINMTDQWQKYEVEFEVPETFLNQLVKLYHDDSVDTPGIYNLLLRLDGSVSNGAWADGTTFSYQVDEVTLKVPTGTSGGSTRPTGDVLPIALVATLASTGVLLFVVVVFKKKKEQ